MLTESFARKLRSLREAQRFSQTEVAESLGVSRQAVNNWESGHNLPSITILPALARALGTTVDDLLAEQPAVSQDNNASVPAKRFPQEAA